MNKTFKKKLTEVSIAFGAGAVGLLIVLMIFGTIVDLSTGGIWLAIGRAELVIAAGFLIIAGWMAINHHVDLAIRSNESQEELMDRLKEDNGDGWAGNELFIRMLRCPYGHSHAFKILDMPAMGHSIPVECPVCERQFTISPREGIAGVIEHDAEVKESPEKTA